jgi:hypothetical protein
MSVGEGGTWRPCSKHPKNLQDRHAIIFPKKGGRQPAKCTLYRAYGLTDRTVRQLQINVSMGVPGGEDGGRMMELTVGSC